MDGAGPGASRPPDRLDRQAADHLPTSVQPRRDPPGSARLPPAGALTLSGAAELTTSLPAIRLLGDAERDQVWRLTAGHPLAMECLDLLLARGERYQDLASRIEAAITAGTDIPRTEPTELPDATAEQIASAAGDLMFGDLFGRLPPPPPRGGCWPSSGPSARRTCHPRGPDTGTGRIRADDRVRRARPARYAPVTRPVRARARPPRRACPGGAAPWLRPPRPAGSWPPP